MGDSSAANRPGDEAFVAFVAGAQSSLHHVAWLLTGDVHQAEELVQDTLVRTYGAWPRVRDDDPYAYTRRVLVNAKTDTWRRRRREDLVEEPPEPSAGRADEDAVDDRLALVAALRALTGRERAVLVLRYFADLSEAATAAELGISVGTVKSTASRALAKLRAADRRPRDRAGTTRSDR
jgi:RNA polymerase sigma-70 factor (sigma-E family)